MLAVIYIFLAACVFWYLQPKQLTFSFGTKTCVRDITFLPGMHRQPDSQIFRLTPSDSLRVGNLSLLSRQTCIQPSRTPAAHSTSKSSQIVAGVIPLKRYQITVTQLPQVLAHSMQPNVGIVGSAELTLSHRDITFEYQLHHAGRQADCAPNGTKLSCQITPLQLDQGKQYELDLLRSIPEQTPQTVASWKVRTAAPVRVTAANFKDRTIYHKPRTFTLTTNKVLVAADAEIRLGSSAGEELASTVSVKDKTIRLQLAKDLPPRKTFVVVVRSATGTDKSHLTKPYIASFRTSGGPKVTGTSMSRYSASRTGTIAIYFDQSLATGQNLASAVTVKANGSSIPFSASSSGRTLYITPRQSFPFCAPLRISTTSAIANPYGLSGDSAWSYSSHTACYTVSTIGSSVRGRPIHAYKFGSGSSMILYVGGTHGNEGGTKQLMDRWIDELNTNPGRIPKNRTITIIPNLSPDSYAAGTRLNARQVDLNRNFPTDDWKSDVKLQSGDGHILIKGGGGSKPLSEPESRALANYVKKYKPRLVLTYHSYAALVTPNAISSSIPLAKQYASISGYRYLPSSSVGSVFTYDTCGAFEDWLPKIGVPALLVELGNNGSEFYRNQKALWAATKW